MFISILRAKIHHARVTRADLNYVGSITIDREIMQAVGLHEFERVLIADVENGNRFETYTMVGEAGSGVIQVNGAAAHLVKIGDRLIVLAFAQVENPDPTWQPTIAIMNERNELTKVMSGAF